MYTLTETEGAGDAEARDPEAPERLRQGDVDGDLPQRPSTATHRRGMSTQSLIDMTNCLM
jgi:hypothetical protein